MGKVCRFTAFDTQREVNGIWSLVRSQKSTVFAYFLLRMLGC